MKLCKATSKVVSALGTHTNLIYYLLYNIHHHGDKSSDPQAAAYEYITNSISYISSKSCKAKTNPENNTNEYKENNLHNFYYTTILPLL